MGVTINSCLDHQILEERKRLRLVLQRLVSITLFLGRQNIAFAGTNSTSGNFYELVQTIAEFDLILKIHLDKNSRNKYLIPETQNELISIIGRKIRSVLLNEVIRSKYYTIILDCTSDVSRKEQMTYYVLCYVIF